LTEPVELWKMPLVSPHALARTANHSDSARLRG
jgi:hypothetical protein